MRAIGLAALAAGICAVPGLAQQSDSGPPLPPPSPAYERAAQAAIRPGDRIVLRVWREKTLNDTMTVDQNYRTVLPQLGVLSVAGQTVGSLPDTLRSLYAQYLRNPSIDIAVLRRIGVLGEVRKPDLYWVDMTMTLPDMIARAGGVTDIGNPNDVKLVRSGHEMSMRDWETRGSLASDLLSGDQIIVERSSWISRNMLTIVSGVGVLTSIVVTVFTLFRL